MPVPIGAISVKWRNSAANDKRVAWKSASRVVIRRNISAEYGVIGYNCKGIDAN
jgi:hypothetical protein